MASVYTRVPLASPGQTGLVVVLHKRKIVEKNNVNKKGKRPNPLSSVTSCLPNSFYYNNDYSIHMFNQKNMLMFCLFLVFLLKINGGGGGVGKMKYSSKKKKKIAVLKHGEQDISQTT